MVTSTNRKGKPKASSVAAKKRAEAAMRLYVQGKMRVSDIAARFHVSPATISVRAKKLGLPPKQRGRWRNEKPSTRQQAILGQLKDLSGAEVARRNQVSRQRIHQIAKRWSPIVKPEHEGVTEFSVNSPAVASGQRVHVISFRLSTTEISALLAKRNQSSVQPDASANQVARAVVSRFLSEKAG
jgi:transposase